MSIFLCAKNDVVVVFKSCYHEYQFPLHLFTHIIVCIFFSLSNFQPQFIQSSIRHALYQKWFRKVKFSTDLINVRGCYWALNRRNEPREWKLPPNKRDFYFGECELPSIVFAFSRSLPPIVTISVSVKVWFAP